MRFVVVFLLAVDASALLQTNEANSVTVQKSNVDQFLTELFGSEANLHQVVASWEKKGLGNIATQREGAPWSKSLRPEEALWWRLTQTLYAAGQMPFKQGYHQRTDPTVERAAVDYWNELWGTTDPDLIKEGSRCAETGDGHFLEKVLGCSTKLSLDFFDKKADVRLDLSLSPLKAPASVKQAHGTMDILLSHQVFEHLQRPTVGMANLNALLKVNGTLVFSTPFAVQDHASPEDFFRYTVHNVRQFLKCGGFEVQKLMGVGDWLSNTAYLANVLSHDMPKSNLAAHCDGMSKGNKTNTHDCSRKYYTAVFAKGKKVRQVSEEDIHTCFG